MRIQSLSDRELHVDVRDILYYSSSQKSLKSGYEKGRRRDTVFDTVKVGH